MKKKKKASALPHITPAPVQVPSARQTLASALQLDNSSSTSGCPRHATYGMHVPESRTSHYYGWVIDMAALLCSSPLSSGMYVDALGLCGGRLPAC